MNVKQLRSLFNKIHIIIFLKKNGGLFNCVNEFQLSILY